MIFVGGGEGGGGVAGASYHVPVFNLGSYVQGTKPDIFTENLQVTDKTQYPFSFYHDQKWSMVPNTTFFYGK